MRNGFVLTAALLAASPAFAVGTHFGYVEPLGDSITAGVTAIGANPGGYRSPLYTELTNAGYSLQFVGGSVVNPDSVLTAAGQTRHGGVSGATIQTQLNRLSIDFAGPDNVGFYPPNIVLLDIGINDIRLGLTDGMVDRYRELIDNIYGYNPNARVLAASVYHFTDRSFDSQIDAFDQAIPQVVAEEDALGRDVEFVDVAPTISLADLDPNDGLHPNPTGNQILADDFAAALVDGRTLVPEPSSFLTSVVAILLTFWRRRAAGGI